MWREGGYRTPDPAFSSRGTQMIPATPRRETTGPNTARCLCSQSSLAEHVRCDGTLGLTGRRDRRTSPHLKKINSFGGKLPTDAEGISGRMLSVQTRISRDTRSNIANNALVGRACAARRWRGGNRRTCIEKSDEKDAARAAACGFCATSVGMRGVNRCAGRGWRLFARERRPGGIGRHFTCAPSLQRTRALVERPSRGQGPSRGRLWGHVAK